MSSVTLKDMTVSQLVNRFVEIGLAQDEASLRDEVAEFNRLFNEMQAVVQELKLREGDQRRALLVLYEHPNMQVRLKAIKNTLAVAPETGRRALKAVANSHHFPQAGEAGMSLINLDRGIFRPT
jgi:hypothetical protein